MVGVWPHGKAIGPAGKAICGLLALHLALCCFGCGRQSQAGMFAVAAAPAATPAPSGRRIPVAADTYISSWSPDANHAADKSLVARSDGAKSLLLRFDLTQVAENAPDRAVLRLYVLRAGALSLTLRAYPLLRPWDARAASWRQAAVGSSWSLPGASDAGRDRADQPVAMALVSREKSWIELDLTATVQEWLKRPDRNYGLLLTGSALEAVECEFASSERRAEQSPYLELVSSKKGSTSADSCTVTCGAECGLVDTTISTSFPESNLSAAQTLELDADGSRAILMRFGDLPREGELARATLSLYVVGGGPGRIEISAYSLVRDWHPQQASWLRALTFARWAEPGAQAAGADYAPALSAAAILTRAGGWLELDITDMVASWLERPELNDGLILRASGVSPRPYAFASVEYPLLEQRPRLTLIYR